jgi:hypothetical protein
MTTPIASLPEGPLDLVGDIHGEIEAMERLLALLGYRSDGSHPEGRHLVFLGDLVDRGRDSIAVVAQVRDMVRAGHASCVLGNHELNLLLEKRREGNEWYWGEVQELREGGRVPQNLADASTQAWIREFLSELPLVLMREDLRAVHAAWSPALVAKLRLVGGPGHEIFREYERRIDAALQREHIDLRSQVADLRRQNQNPVGVATSGIERPTLEPFWAGGRLRRVERVRWWDDYRDQPAIVFGHYWRAMSEQERPSKAGPYLFEDVAPEDALGPLSNAFCVDFSVGVRNVERAQGRAYGLDNALAALRFPELELVFDRGEARRVQLGAQASSSVAASA